MGIRVLSLFSGIGAYETALNRIGMEYEIINYCEIDNIISKSYSLLHNTSERLNLGNITTVNETKIDDFDLMTFSFPCKDITIMKSDNGQGLNGIKSRTYYDGLKILKYKKPKYCIIENVDNLLSKQHIKSFNSIIQDLNDAGYNNYYKLLNAMHFGIPQNRNRIYIVSIRKDIDNKTFTFPEGNTRSKWWEFINPYETRELTKRQLRRINEIKSGIIPDIKVEGIPQFDCSVISLRKSGLRFQSNDEHPTITAYYGTGGGNFTMLAYKGHIGGITPRQCFRLMDFSYEQYDILQENGIPTMYLYIMAGNTVVVKVLEEIFKQLFYPNGRNAR